MKKEGFSLVELLTSLLIISLIVTAMTPIITRKITMTTRVKTYSELKSGLQLFTNPGVYSFDIPINVNEIYISGSGSGGGGGGVKIDEITKTFYAADEIFTVPKGVNKVTLKITGSGGGGGGMYAKEGTDYSKSDENNLRNNLKHNECLPDEFMAIRGAQDESDLCYTRDNISWKNIYNDGVILEQTGAYSSNINHQQGEECQATTVQCCWEGINGNYCTSSGCSRPVCNIKAALAICQFYQTQYFSNFFPSSYYRLPNKDELRKILKYIDDWSFSKSTSTGLNLCIHSFDINSKVPVCYATWACLGAANSRCDFNSLLGSDSSSFWLQRADSYLLTENTEVAEAGAVRCARPLKRYVRYHGSGGNSGAQLIKEVNVLPDDTISFKAAQGGAGGAMGNNGGSGQEVVVSIYHKSTNSYETYGIKGGLGGKAATDGASGKSWSVSETNPSKTCWSASVKNPTDSQKTNIACTQPSYRGEEGLLERGGNGASVADTGTAATGGFLYIDANRGAYQRYTGEELRRAKGENATQAGFGGGGGFAPAWMCETNCGDMQAKKDEFKGGAGAAAALELSYKLATAAGGGGAGANIGVSEDGTIDKEIVYKVNDKERRLVLIIPKGGAGGENNFDGEDGADLIISSEKRENIIVLKGGKKGKTTAQGGEGGEIVILNKDDIKNYDEIKNIKGNSGSIGAQDNPNCTNYGFNGGSGGSTALLHEGGLAGGLMIKNESTGICTQRSENGENAASHNPARNSNGSAGGGGGGIALNSLIFGKGGAGADGYLRIRWGE